MWLPDTTPQPHIVLFTFSIGNETAVGGVDLEWKGPAWINGGVTQGENRAGKKDLSHMSLAEAMDWSWSSGNFKAPFHFLYFALSVLRHPINDPHCLLLHWFYFHAVFCTDMIQLT